MARLRPSKGWKLRIDLAFFAETVSEESLNDSVQLSILCHSRIVHRSVCSTCEPVWSAWFLLIHYFSFCYSNKGAATAGMTCELYSSSTDCLVKTFRHEGPSALYKGFIPNWVRLGPWNVVFFITYEQLKMYNLQHPTMAPLNYYNGPQVENRWPR